MTMSDSSPIVVLVSPQMGENIGACARAMLNFGVTQLRIVNPRDGWPNPKALEMAKGAKHVVENAHIAPTLPEALQDVHYVYGSSARLRDMVKPVLSPEEYVEAAYSHITQGAKVALLFGPEKTGLTNDDMALCDAVVMVPVSPVYPSLNLAQAVAVLSYEWFRRGQDSNSKNIDEPIALPATQAQLHGLFEHLEHELDVVNFWRVEEKRAKMVHNLRNMLVRANLTDQDVRTLRGIIKSLRR